MAVGSTENQQPIEDSTSNGRALDSPTQSSSRPRLKSPVLDNNAASSEKSSHKTAQDVDCADFPLDVEHTTVKADTTSAQVTDISPHPSKDKESNPIQPDCQQLVDEFGLPVRTCEPEKTPRRRFEYEEKDEDENFEIQKAHNEPVENPKLASQEKAFPDEPKPQPIPEQLISSSQHVRKCSKSTIHSDAVAGNDNLNSSNSPARKPTMVSSHSHMVLSGVIAHKDKENKKADFDSLEWQVMPAYAPFNMYDDSGRLIALEKEESTDGESGISDSDSASEATKGAAKSEVKGGKDKSSKSKKKRDRFGTGVGNEYSAFDTIGHGYHRVVEDDDVRSVTSLDKETAYLFQRTKSTSHDKNEGEPESDDDSGDDLGFDYQAGYGSSFGTDDDDDELLDESNQLAMTKGLLSERERIGYVGLVRVSAAESEAWMGRLIGKEYVMNAPLRVGNPNTSAKMMKAKLKAKGKTDKAIQKCLDGMAMWRQSVALRVYNHMEVSAEEQVMTEQLFEHGVGGADLAVGLKPEDSDNDFDNREANDADGEGEDKGKGGYHKRNLSSHGHDRNDLRWALLCDLLLILLSDGTYDARSRELLFRVAHHLGLPSHSVSRFESKVAHTLELARDAESDVVTADASDHIVSRRRMTQRKRLALMGLATLGGGLVIGLSAGLLAPVIGAGLAAGFTTIGVAGTGGFLAGAGGAAVVTTSGVVAGSTVGLRAAGRRTGAVQTFNLKPVADSRRLSVIIGVSGWMTGHTDDVRLPFSTVDPSQGDIYALEWEPELLRSMGATITILATEAFTQGLQQLLGSTILMSLMAAVQVPILLTKLAYLIDNPWAVSQSRADAAGKILADILISRGMGKRPVTLVGYSLGARLVYSCLLELARRCESSSEGEGLGIVHDVYLFGAPVVVNRDEWRRVRSMVSGRFVNGYATSDWILGYLFRATGGGVLPVAGLGGVNLEGQSVSLVTVDVMEKAAQEQDRKNKEEKDKKRKSKGEEEPKDEQSNQEEDDTNKKQEKDKAEKEAAAKVIPRWTLPFLIENIDCSDLVSGHMAYRAAMPKLLKRVGFHVTADEFPEPEAEEKGKGKGKKAGSMKSSVAMREKERLEQLLQRVEQAGRDREEKERQEREERLRREKSKQKKKKGIWGLGLWAKSQPADGGYDVEEEEERIRESKNAGLEQSRTSSNLGDSTDRTVQYEPYDPDVLFDVEAIAAEVAAVAGGQVGERARGSDEGTPHPESDPGYPVGRDTASRSRSTSPSGNHSTPHPCPHPSYDIEPDWYLSPPGVVDSDYSLGLPDRSVTPLSVAQSLSPAPPPTVPDVSVPQLGFDSTSTPGFSSFTLEQEGHNVWADGAYSTPWKSSSQSQEQHGLGGYQEDQEQRSPGSLDKSIGRDSCPTYYDDMDEFAGTGDGDVKMTFA